MGTFHTRFKIWVVLIIEDPAMIVNNGNNKTTEL